MASALTLIGVFSLFVASATALKINQTCMGSTDCTASHSLCNIPSPTCGGICSCIPGFTYDPSSGNCKRAVYLGGTCSQSNDACVGDNMECTGSGSCSCKFGYKQGLHGTDCVPNLMTLTAGDTCHDSAQCYYSLVCIENKCGCYPGYKPFGKYSCSARQVYDSCSSNDDCQMAMNSVCSNGRCDCLPGYRAIQYQADIATKGFACIGSGEGLSAEGSSCNLNIDKGQLVYCQSPYVCSSCGERSVCIRSQPFILSGDASLAHLSASTILLAAVAVVVSSSSL